MVDIRPKDLPGASLPLGSSNKLIVDQDLGGVNNATPFDLVESVAPVASQSDAEIGADNIKRMTALRVKQSIASEVGVSVASYASGQAGLSAVQSVNGKSGTSITLVKADVGLSNVDNTSDANKPVSTAQQTALNLKADKSISITGVDGVIGGGDLTQSSTLGLSPTSKSSLLLADTAVQPSITVTAGDGLTGGGTLASNRTIALSSASIASLAKADSAVQPSVLDGYATIAQLATKFDKPNGTTSQYIRGDGSLSAFPAIPQGTVTSVGVTVPTGLSASGSPVTSSGTISVSYATGYQGYTSAESSKLSGIAAGAQVNTVNSVNTKTGAVVLNASDVGAAPSSIVTDVNANTAARHTHSNKTILDATTASFLAAEKTKLSGIEAGAQVNTVTSVAGKTGAVTLVKGDVGLGSVDNTSDAAKPVSTATQTALNAKANSSVTVSAGTGLTGGGNLTANRTVALNAASIASLGKADTALQAPGGATGQILAKSSAADNDVGWVSSEAATAVSYGPQTLTSPQQDQARTNINALGKTEKATDSSLLNGNTEAQLPISTATQSALNGKVNKSGDLMSGYLEFSGSIGSQIRNQIGVTLANEAVISITQSGILILNDFSSGSVGLFILGGHGGGTVAYLSPSSSFGTDNNPDGKINVFFWPTPTPHYEIKNQTGASRSISMLLIATRDGV